jgi:hypothetical protein
MDHPVARHAATSDASAGLDGSASQSAGSPRRAKTSFISRGRGATGILTVVAILVIAIIAVVFAWITGSMSSGALMPASHQSAVPDRPSSAGRSPASDRTSVTAATRSTGNSATQGSIRLTGLVESAKPFQAVAISGTHRAGPSTLLQVQRREQGRWVSFPLPTMTDRSGQFSTYVELSEPGLYWLRVLDPGSGATSDSFRLVIKV